ncbi:ExeM/NucH family extracellular endonuclease [Miniimonas arenae]|uniref:ExeM/NucH family extracellular endonuclease n=1 Tax=Miniimonas arenae TaxID=676201 RepID=UPI00319E0BE1
MIVPATAYADVSADAAVVINEVYGGGGGGSSVYQQDFVELRNTSAAPVDLTGYSVQYAAAAGTNWSGRIDLAGSIAPGDTFLVVTGTAGSGTPTPTGDVTGSVNLAQANGNVALVSRQTALTCATTACATDDAVVDLVGYGTGAAFAGSGPATGMSQTTSVARNAAGTNTGNNAADFAAGAPTPQASTGTTPTPEPTTEPTVAPTTEPTIQPTTGPTTGPTTEPTSEPTAEPTGGPTAPSWTPIAQIQGTGTSVAVTGTVTTRGVVTAAYPTGGFAGYVIQTPGTGGTTTGRTASDAIFVYSPNTVAQVEIGDYVEVTGAAGEFNGLSQVDLRSGTLTELTDEVEPVVPLSMAWPATDAEREAIESMLLAPAGDYTVTNTYSTNQYAEVGLASGTTPLRQPTDVARPNSVEAAAVVADNASRAVTLDDGATTNFLAAANQSQTPPYVSLTDPVRVGAPVTFTHPVVVDYRNNTWKLAPTSQVTPADPAAYPATFANTRTAGPDAAAIGDADLTLASFNVLNYFTTLGADTPGCTAYTDRTGNGVTVNSGCDPRGAWDADDLKRQQDKIVAAIGGIDASVIGLMEIENSAKLGETPDEATATLVAALNAAAGTTKWAYVPSSTELPPVSTQDVITNAIIYQPAEVTPDGASHALGTASGTNQAFDNAREPIGQRFVPAGDSGDDEDAIFVVVNHFKSKGSAGPLPGDADSGDGQGASNASRVAQATALRDWLPTVTEEGDAVALVGDFNSYGTEDPLEVLYDDGFTDVEQHFDVPESSYSFSGLSGSLDHVLLNEAALARATGADIWSINSGESIALEYSRYNYHGTLFYAPDAYRSSDHDPVVVGLTADGGAAEPIELDLVNLNDFHGRIDANTVKVAGTVEQLRAQNPEGTVFVSAGDNIGASLFASALQQDQPTIDVLNALDLATSAVGNHEFDQGYADLTDRVIGADKPNAQWAYLGANVYEKGTQTPALPEYDVVEVDGVRLGFVGVVTEETPTLVTPSGIADLDFGDPVEALNRVTGELLDGDESNGEADVVVALVHEGAGAGTPDGATIEQEIAAGGAFADVVTGTDPRVAAFLTGHTHKQYAWDAPITGTDRTRPVIQTGSYGEFVGHTTLLVDPGSFEVVDYAVENVARTTTSDAELVAAYPRVADVKTIVDAALAEATVIGAQPVGAVTSDITTAFAGGSFANGVWTGGTRDDRASESALGNLVASSLRDTLADDSRGGADIGVVNPGGLRSELYYAPDGVVTYAEANGVLPFVNNLWTVTLTGAQLDTLLEQQWQTNADGVTRPSRPYLALGLSDNVTWVADTADGNATPGDNVSAIYVNGELVQPDDTFTVATFSFLATGGDNFRVFTQGTGVRDSGLVDRDAWIDYITANSPLTPSFARTRTVLPALPGTVEAGSDVTLDLAGLNLTSLGAPANASVSVTLGDALVGTAPVLAGTSSVTVTVPADAVAGDTAFTVTVDPAGTVAQIPVTIAAAAEKTVDLTLLNVNDFHGRIDANTVKVAGTIEQQRAEVEAAGGEVAFLSAGDNIGASLFASSVAQDQPTIDVLNALDLAASAVGNHEFDGSFADLTDRVIGSEADPNADWTYLGANVYDATGNPVLPEYELLELGDVTVGVIGAVTQETPSLVSPGGIEGLTFGDPVEAVNRVAAQLTDGDPANGEADVLVAEYHEGAGAGTPDGATLEEEVAAGGAFADIVTKTSASVDVIFTGHTHKQYAWDAPVPGVDGATRPVLQTGSYGEFVGRVDLTYDTETDTVTAHTATNVARTTTADAELVAAYPRVAEVKTIVDAALAYADVIGAEPVGSVTADITTAFAGGSYVNGVWTGGTRDDRASESALGNLVANSLVESLSAPERGAATIGVVNPGGLRAELLRGADGVITYAEANAVLPFVNNLWTTTLTGDQVIEMLEQQWQTTATGTVPSRPFLKLGLSENVSYTYDPDPDGDGVLLGDLDDQGRHITSVTVDGAPIDEAGQYRIGSFSFLLQGGDNFRIFTSGTDTRDSGLIDRDAWIDYLRDASPLSPDFAKQAVAVEPVEPVVAGGTLAVTLSRFDLTSLGAPQNTTATALLGGTAVGTATVSGGSVTLNVVVPATTPVGQQLLTVRLAPSGTEVTIPIEVEAAPPVKVTTTTSLWLSQQDVRKWQILPVLATSYVRASDGSFVTGTVEIRSGDRVVSRAPVFAGVSIALIWPWQQQVGTQELTATFIPRDGGPAGSTSAPVKFRVR